MTPPILTSTFVSATKKVLPTNYMYRARGPNGHESALRMERETTTAGEALGLEDRANARSRLAGALGPLRERSSANEEYTDDGAGVALQDVWTDIKRLDPHSLERTGYDTQKPVDLLTRLIYASTERGSVVVDPFGGSGTTAVAAERLGRGWISADASLLAASFTLARTRQESGRAQITLKGFPRTKASAEALRSADPQTFAVWGTSMLSTLMHRKDFLRNLLRDPGKVQIPNRLVDVVSFVPLAVGPDAVEPPRKRKRLPSQAIVLDSGSGVEGLTRSVRERMPSLPITVIPLEGLVTPQSQSSGMANGVTEAVERSAS